MLPTTINDRWTLLLPEHRHARTEWPVWEKERLAAMHDVIAPQTMREQLYRFCYDAEGPVVDPPELPRHVVFDIGAEEGDFPALWASWGADVVMVEPNPKVWPNIRAIFDANGLRDRVRGCHVGFAGDEWRAGSWNPQPGGNDDRPDDVCGDCGWPRCAHGPVIGDHGFLVLPERPEVPVTTIDTLAADYGDPTVITIDVEGAELTVLRGAHVTLKEARPVVFVSIHLDLPWIDEKYPGDTEERVYAYMNGLGYVGTELAVDHEKHVEFRHVTVGQ
jgi:FkbM family methyltransferase